MLLFKSLCLSGFCTLLCLTAVCSLCTQWPSLSSHKCSARSDGGWTLGWCIADLCSSVIVCMINYEAPARGRGTKVKYKWCKWSAKCISITQHTHQLSKYSWQTSLKLRKFKTNEKKHQGLCRCLLHSHKIISHNIYFVRILHIPSYFVQFD